MSTATPDPKLVIPDCATCDHPAVRAFIETVSAVETGAPTWHVLNLCRELARLGYKLDLIAPADDAELPPAPWCWHLKGARIVSGLPIGTTLATAPGPAPSAGPTLPNAQDRATFERRTGQTRQGPTRPIDPSPQPSPPSPAREMTPSEPLLQRTLPR